MFNEEEEPFWLTMIMVCVSGVLLISVTLIWRRCLLLKNQKKNKVAGTEMNVVGVGGGRANGGNVFVVAAK